VVPLYWGSCVTGRSPEEQVRWLAVEGDDERALRAAVEKVAAALGGGARPLTVGSRPAGAARAQEVAS
jgi:hypothetical protein